MLSISAFVLLTIINLVKADLTKNCTSMWYNMESPEPPCTGNYSVEVLRQVRDYPKAVIVCCIPGSQLEIDLGKEANKCEVTSCISATNSNPCNSLPERHINRQKLDYQNLAQESCSISRWWWPFWDEQGAIALCCPTTSSEKWLMTMAGAEDHEFPHQALLTTKTDKGFATCGATVYNRRFLITAAHCVLEIPFDWIVRNVTRMKVTIGSNIRGIQEPKYNYGVKQVIPHAQYNKYVIHGWMWIDWGDNRNSHINDIALVELDRDIEFSQNVKALEIAPKDFSPSAFADKLVFIGCGNSQGRMPAAYLRKQTALLRTDEQCSERLGSIYEGKKKRVICVGGMMDGEFAPAIVSGDSGGPAICRGENAYPVLCGVISFGPNLELCQENWNQSICLPNTFTKVSYYNEWIEELAGPQEPDTLHKPILFGRKVQHNEYMHQVRIFRETDGKSCGGTLIDKDVMITSAKCVFDTNQATLRSNLTVKSASGTMITVKTAKALPNFSLRVAANKTQTLYRVLNDSIYDSNLAVVLLNASFDIPQTKIPRLPISGETFSAGMEVAAGNDGVLMSREFTLLPISECKERVRKARVSFYSKQQNKVVCGVEKYSGGSTCDRELGGGLICQGTDGKDVLCGVQSFRPCISSLPNEFVNIEDNVDWIQDAIADLRFSTQDPQGFLDTYYRIVFKSYI